MVQRGDEMKQAAAKVGRGGQTELGDPNQLLDLRARMPKAKVNIVGFLAFGDPGPLQAIPATDKRAFGGLGRLDWHCQGTAGFLVYLPPVKAF